MLIRFGRNGAFLACSSYPECRNTSNFTRDEQGAVQPVENEPVQQEKVGLCPECRGDLVIKKARSGSRFIACDNYPRCRHTEPLSTGVPCPVEHCSGVLVEKGSRRGKVFYGCNQYPECTYALWNPPVSRDCTECGSKVLVRKNTKTRGEHLACPEKKCRYWEMLDHNA